MEAASGTSDSLIWQVLSKNMQELKEMLSLETQFRVKTRLLAKVSFAMANHPAVLGNDQQAAQTPGKKISFMNNEPVQQQHQKGRSGLRRSISESSVMAAAAAASSSSANPAGKVVPFCYYWHQGDQNWAF